MFFLPLLRQMGIQQHIKNILIPNFFFFLIEKEMALSLTQSKSLEVSLPSALGAMGCQAVAQLQAKLQHYTEETGCGLQWGLQGGKTTNQPQKQTKPQNNNNKKPQRFSVKTSTEKTRLSVENNPAHPPTHPLLFQAVSAANFSLQKNSDTHYAPGLCNCQYQKTKVR